MEQILVAREAGVKFFKRYEVFIVPLLKFFLGLLVFGGITSVGHTHSMVDTLGGSVSPALLTFLFALLFTIMPMNMSWIVIILTITLQFSANIQVAAAVFIFLMLIFLFYARMATRESILIIFTILAFHFNVPYLLPIMAGLYFPITSVIPITLGVFIHAQIDGLLRLMAPTAATAAAADRDLTEILTELPGAFSEVYTTIMSSFASTDAWIFTTIIFAMVIVLVHFVSRQAIDYAKEMAIGLGCVMMIFGFIISVLFSDSSANIGIVILGTVVCGLIAGIVRFFDGILDYQRAETVQFEDDNNFYHVKVVPKVIMTKSQRSVKRIRPQLPEDPLEQDDSERNSR
ncbi:MAG: hypothetical protein FWB96_09315 [Defluviitaleaceae bacterium]|nr:hypothetical protein [Defluviitaleaceae bacterium]MCL2263038.1 hypothetical protein [Defluviitaleaceae bacterium]